MNQFSYTIFLWFGIICTLLSSPILAQENTGYLRVDTSSAVVSLLQEARDYYEKSQNEQAAALLERALRIDPRNPVLWHNLAGVRLQQQDWKRAANLANKSNSLSAHDRWLRVRNWVVIALACEGMGDMDCTVEARRRARTLAD